MPITVLSEWFLLEFKIAQLKAYLALEKLRRFNRAILFQLQEMYQSIASIALWRLILLVLKRLGSITKNWLKENKIDEWLKAILHGAYLGVFEGLYIFLYFLHFFRAFLTIIDYFSDQDNKNLVEVSKLLYAVFKILISLLMLTFMIMMLVHGIAFLNLALYHNIKIFFLIYSLSKLAMSFFTLGFSFIQYKNANNALDQVWLKKQYKNNLKKHREILIVAVPITLILSLLSLGLVTGPWFWGMVALASVFLIIDAVKAIYYYVKGSSVPEPSVAQLPQQNAFFHDASNNYYYRKCRIARLKNNDPEGNRIFLLKEIIVKIIQLQAKLENNSISRFGFFSEKEKIQKKIDGLIQDAQELLKDKPDKIALIIQLAVSLQEDLSEIKDDPEMVDIVQEYLRGLKNQLQVIKQGDDCAVKLNLNNKNNKLWKLIFAEEMSKESIPKSQAFRQSFFRKKADCEDIHDACQKFRELEQHELNTETRLQVFPQDITMSLLLLLILIVPMAILLFKSFFTVSQQSVDVIERFGKYTRCAHAGLNFKIPFVERIAGAISLRIYPLDVTLDTKTQDNVIVKIQVSVQYRIKEDRVYDAFYKLENAREQITAYVLDLVRAEVPTMSLDAVFEKKDSIANAVKNELTGTMQEFGYEIVKALVTNIDPDEKVKHAMNEINEQQRLQVAAQAKGEAEKILKVKQAEAEAESKRLQGEGIANQRKAIICGLQQSVGEFQKAIPGVTAADTMNLALITQYFDTLKEIGANSKSTTILLPHSSGGLKDIAAQLQESIITGNLVANTENSE
ncbi:hypothetical protein FQR65_LT11303 [Abscondita terminalis]|nr:hypothetical protein FQR65_LT11303 [Abscondita terminalis]